ncbi:Zinc finger protein 263 [Harpegnathos saltator]|uniref:Zinc finger protein 263 n=1 Tax=Harpegnathos saltator TaxID=610380 RepID=E2BJ97_HARSA|nr:Zinc finger protein 263 [Harpegnathos saltator]
MPELSREQKSSNKKPSNGKEGVSEKRETEEGVGGSGGNLINGKCLATTSGAQTKKRVLGPIADIPDARRNMPSTSTAGTKKQSPKASTSNAQAKKGAANQAEVVALTSDSTDTSDNESSPWTNSKNVARERKAQNHKCPHCNDCFEYRNNLMRHITTNCMSNPQSRARKEAGLYRCEVCGRCYSQSKGLRYHQRHECQKTVQCPDCFTTMKGSVITDRHKRDHCVNKRRDFKAKRELAKTDEDELFVNDSSDEL